MKKISVFIITFNEAKYIKQAIQSVRHFDEVIVVDSGSTDDTVAIAKEMGAHVVHHDWQGYARQKSYAMGLCRNQWCLNIDGDEILPAQCETEILQLINDDSCDAIRLPISDHFMGQELPEKVKKRSIVRVFKKDHIEYPLDRSVHENVIVNGKERKAQNHLIHLGYNSVPLLMEKQNLYSSLKANDKFEKGKKPSLIKLLLVFPFSFIKCFFFRGLWRAGRRGLIFAMIESMYAFLKEAKLLEKNL